jgi:2-keto-4-pentenoate hydratase/2-oxohepta-3-ene-1,7-dioic acid hydratase in catechol pathway
VRIALFNDYRLGIVEGDQIADVTSVLAAHDPTWPFAFVPRMIMGWDTLGPRIASQVPHAPRLPLTQVTLRPPIPNPSNVAAAASNYRAHAAEMSQYMAEGRFGQAAPSTAPRPTEGGLKSGLPDVPGRPPGERGEVFLKSSSSVVGPGETIYLPDTTPGKEVHHEGEFAAVIGKEAYRVSRREALDHVFGYMGLMDITVRGDGDRSRRKSYRGFTPIGPWIVTRDEIPDPQNVNVVLTVNGQPRQDANTEDQIETLAEVIEYASYCYPLRPGDIVTTGSPAGVGQIHDGDVIKLEIQGIGSFTINVKAMPS